MNNRKVLLSVVITLVVVAVLFAGGYAIYRFGYTRGAAESFAGPMMRGFAGEFGNERGMPFHEFDGQGDFHQRMPMLGYAHPGFVGQSALGGFGGLLLLIGVGALVVIAINSFQGRGAQDTSAPAEPTGEPKAKRRAS